MPPKKSVKVSFVTSGTEKIAKKVEDFQFLPSYHQRLKKNEYSSLLIGKTDAHNANIFYTCICQSEVS